MGRQALELVTRRGKDVSRPGSRTTGTSGDGGTSTKSADGRTGPVEGIAETLYSIRNAAKSLRPREIREGLKTVAQEAENVVSRCVVYTRILLRSGFLYLQVSTDAHEVVYCMAGNTPPPPLPTIRLLHLCLHTPFLSRPSRASTSAVHGIIGDRRLFYTTRAWPPNCVCLMFRKAGPRRDCTVLSTP